MLLRRHAPMTGRPLEEVDLPAPEPGPGELLVRVSVCAVCRTDLHVIEGDLPTAKLPVVPGHQIVGRVEKTGEGCTRFGPGDRVGVAWLRHTCGQCDFCRRGNENLCRSALYTGYHADGGYAEQTVVGEAYAYAIPGAFEDEHAAPLLCAGIIGYRALSRSALPRGGRLGLFGFGSSAHVVLQIALHRGCDVYVSTRGESHRELARRLGARWVGETLDALPVELDSAIVFAPAGGVVPAALRAVGPGGTVSLAGSHMTPIPEMDYESCLFHEKNLCSVEANTRADGEALLAEAAEIPIRPEVTSFPLARANDVLVDLKQDRIDGTGLLVCASRPGC
jgi:propanol-preferring alcohol dehydrogenase